MLPPLLLPASANRGQDILHCYHAAMASRKAAHQASILGDEDLRQMYLDQASWRIDMAMRYGGCLSPH